MNRDNDSSFKLPALESLPGPDASLRDLGRFTYDHDPTLLFHKEWGENYQEKVQALWQRLNHAFRNGEQAVGRAEELMMGMAYDWALGPYLGVPESKKEAFLKWLLVGIRNRLRDRA